MGDLRRMSHNLHTAGIKDSRKGAKWGKDTFDSMVHGMELQPGGIYWSVAEISGIEESLGNSVPTGRSNACCTRKEVKGHSSLHSTTREEGAQKAIAL